jgi:WD40 repeat protein
MSAYLAIGNDYDKNFSITLLDVECAEPAPGSEFDESKAITIPNAHNGCIYDMVYSNDNTRLASASHDGFVKVWAILDGGFEEEAALPHGCVVHCACFNTYGDRIASCSADAKTRVWDLASKSCVYELNNPSELNVQLTVFTADTVCHMRFVNNDTSLVVHTSTEIVIRVVETSEIIWMLSAQLRLPDISCIAVHPRGHEAAVSIVPRGGWLTKSVLKVEFQPGGIPTEIRSALADNSKLVTMCHNCSGRHLAAGYNNKTVVIVDVTSFDWVATLPIGYGPTRLAFNEFDTRLAVCVCDWSASKGVRLWDLQGCTETSHVPIGSCCCYPQPQGSILM